MNSNFLIRWGLNINRNKPFFIGRKKFKNRFEVNF